MSNLLPGFQFLDNLVPVESHEVHQILVKKISHKIWVLIFLVLIGFLAFFFRLFSAPKEVDGIAKPGHKQIELYDLEALHAKITSDCPGNNFGCLDKKLIETTFLYGPKASLELTARLQSVGAINKSEDDHQLAHRIGRETAKTFGLNPDAFLSCPTSYNYGCQHGFFEYALGRTSSTKEAAILICGSLDKDPAYSSKFKFYCYHGLGHGVLMAQAYDLYGSLDTCDSLSDHTGQTGCWQGVFMENVNGGMRGEVRDDVFSTADPLAPCSKVEEKYRQQCFLNHAGWLMRFFNNDLGSASAACLKAPPNHINTCLESLGLMVSNPSWQVNLTSDVNKRTTEEIAWELCLKFPQDHLTQCVSGGIDNLMNFNELNIDSPARFCGLVSPNFKPLCYLRIGISLRGQTVDDSAVVRECSKLEEEYKNICLGGAGFRI